jgi:hypothetical protein
MTDGSVNSTRSVLNTEGKETSSISGVWFEAVVLVRAFDHGDPSSKYGSMLH